MGVSVMNEQQQAQASIKTMYERLASAWAVGDAMALGSLLALDCDHTTLGATSHVKRGRAELVESWANAFSRRCPHFSVRLQPSLHSIRLLGSDLALVDGKLDYTGGVGPRGVEAVGIARVERLQETDAAGAIASKTPRRASLARPPSPRISSG